MSKSREIWWSYAKAMIRQYPELDHAVGAQPQLSATKQKEYDAVMKAVEITNQMPNGKTRMAIIELVLWKQACTVEQAAARLYVSEPTAKRYHGAFIRLVGNCYGLTD